MTFAPYFLSDNPFPSNPMVDVTSTDKRINGTIFFEGVFIRELTKLRQQIESKTNMIYVAGLQFQRGVGKSAILSHVWRELKQNDCFYTSFIRCIGNPPTNKPVGFSLAIIENLHEQGYIWRAFWKLVLRFAQDRRSSSLTKESIEVLVKSFPEPVDDLPLTIYTHVAHADRLATEMSRWLRENLNCGEHLSSVLTTCYFSEPNTFPKKIATGSRTVDPIKSFGDVLTILKAAGYEWGYFFLDNLEDSIMATSTGKMGEFSLGIRRMLEVSTGKASMTVTLHPDSEQKLNANPSAQNLHTLAPIDEMRYISLNVLDPKSELVIPLAVDYIKNFRIGSAPSETFPFEPEVIRYICFLKQGSIREILLRLYQCIDFGARKGNPIIDMRFVLENHDMTMGSQIDQEKYADFKRLNDRATQG